MSEKVSREECSANVSRVLDKVDTLGKTLGREMGEVKDILRGSEGRGGLVADVNHLKTQNRIFIAGLSISTGVIAAVLTNIIIQLVSS